MLFYVIFNKKTRDERSKCFVEQSALTANATLTLTSSKATEDLSSGEELKIIHKDES